MEILQGVYIKQLCIWLASHNTLVIPDIHLGYEENLRKQGVLVPKNQYAETLKMLQQILAEIKIKPDKIVLIGDIKHEFGNISKQEWSETTNLFFFLKSKCNELIILKGNHDKILEPIAEKSGLKTKDHILIGDFYLCHGDFIPENKDFKLAKKLIIGHEHPAISIRDKVRSETYKCFLLGKYKSKDLIVMPSMNLLIEGTDILKDEILSPFLKNGVSDFKVFAISEDKVYDFGKVKDLPKPK